MLFAIHWSVRTSADFCEFYTLSTYVTLWRQIFFCKHGKSPLKDQQKYRVSIVDLLIVTSQCRCMIPIQLSASHTRFMTTLLLIGSQLSVIQFGNGSNRGHAINLSFIGKDYEITHKAQLSIHNSSMKVYKEIWMGKILLEIFPPKLQFYLENYPNRSHQRRMTLYWPRYFNTFNSFRPSVCASINLTIIAWFS